MTRHLLQKGYSRGRWANRMGLALLAAFVMVLLISVALGLHQLGAA
jgi:hypothetical protein